MFKFKKYFNIIFFFVFLILIGCAKDENVLVSPSTPRSPFAGKYSFKFISLASGTSQLNINNDGKFEFSMDLNLSGNSQTYNVKGEVKKNGILDAVVKQDTIAFGVLSGQFYNGEGSGYLTGGTVALWKAVYIF